MNKNLTPKGKAELHGSVERVVSRNDETSWSVLRILNGNQSTIIVGLMPQVDEGLEIHAQGAWHNHPKFGAQFKASSVRVHAPVSRDGIERFLRSGAVNGIGKKFASMIVERFGEKTLDVIEKDSWRLKYLKGVGPKRIEAVRKGVKEYRGRMETMSFLHGKLGPTRAQKVYQKYGDEARKIISGNPYRLIEDFEGVGFAIADQVARDVGVDIEHELRKRAAVLTVLQQAGRQGHTCLPINTCRSESSKLLGSEVLGEAAVALETETAPWSVVVSKGVKYLELDRYRFLDKRVAELLAEFQKAEEGVPILDSIKAIPWAEKQAGLNYEKGQQEAIALGVASKIGVITGGPGVGKTTILDALLRIFSAKKFRVALAAPTGRAARRMTESTGHEAATIHKLLEYSPRAGGFLRKRGNPLDIDVLIVDEVSMLDLPLCRSLLEAMPINGKLLAVGDQDQLPSVGPGRVLADLIASGVVPIARLSKPYRQAEGSAIIANAHLVNAGIVPELDNKATEFEFIETRGAEQTGAVIEELVAERLPAEGVNPKTEALVLVPIHRGAAGVEKLNLALQARINGTPCDSVERGSHKIGVGDKVMQTRNSADLGISNGDLGIVKRIDSEKKVVTVTFDIGDVEIPNGEVGGLSLAYAQTIHKAQGSEADVVVIGIDMSSAVLLGRKLLYTAITRAKRRVIMVGQKRAVHIAVSEARAHNRNTLLRERILECRDQGVEDNPDLASTRKAV